jgi:hypothetical protein
MMSACLHAAETDPDLGADSCPYSTEFNAA